VVKAGNGPRLIAPVELQHVMKLSGWREWQALPGRLNPAAKMAR